MAVSSPGTLVRASRLRCARRRAPRLRLLQRQARLPRQRPLPHTDYEGAARKSAEDLRIAITFGSRLPQVDPTRVLAVGISTGGMATVALTAEAPKI
ncbi:hypothetical protein [Tunturiibacter gelidiferens]|uniref:hypothetical protein n=1 Tax=Tunturiibacter gelidiferens TaxID=3069689 RepID=UPI003D9B6444